MENTSILRNKSAAAQRWARTGHILIFTSRAALGAQKRRGQSPGISPQHIIQIPNIIDDEKAPLIAHDHQLPSAPEVQPSSLSPPSPSLYSQLKSILFASHFNILLLCLPASFISYYGHFNPGWTFTLGFFTLIPLAHLLGTFTEDLALRSSNAIGALLNATFGNATELIISIFALKANMYTVIKNSLIGSVLGNMMLVLGTAVWVAGWKHSESSFNSNAVRVYVSLLLLASLGLIIPTTFHSMPSVTEEMTLHLSRAVAVFMVAGYVMYLWFQLYTHRLLFADEEDAEEAGEPQYSATVSVVALAITTILISFESEFLVDTLEATAHQWGLSQAFIGVILLPIVGNAAEHATAILMAYRNKMDIALGVAVGSSIQIALFVVPLLVIIAALTGHQLDLNFTPFSAVVMFVSVVIIMSLVLHGRTHWLAGAMLLLAYCMLSATYLFTPDSVYDHINMINNQQKH